MQHVSVLLREAVELEERIRRMSRTPTQAMSVVAHALSPFPHIAIAEFTWSSVNLCDVRSVTLNRRPDGTLWVDYD